MMVQPTLVLVAALLINYCSTESVYCVTLTATLCSSCLYSNHCATLSEYVQETGVYFTSNTTMVFLPGDHSEGAEKSLYFPKCQLPKRQLPSKSCYKLCRKSQLETYLF